MKDLYERVLAFLFALPFVVLSFSAVFFAEMHRARLVDEGQVVISESGQYFGSPQEYWLLTPIGIAYLIALLLGLIAICLILSRYLRDFNLKLWLLIFGFGWITVNASFITNYCVHRDDYISISNDEIEQKFGTLEWQAKYSETRNVKRKGKAFIIYFKDHKTRRITDARISRLYDKERLSESLLTLAKKFEEN